MWMCGQRAQTENGGHDGESSLGQRVQADAQPYRLPAPGAIQLLYQPRRNHERRREDGKIGEYLPDADPGDAEELGRLRRPDRRMLGHYLIIHVGPATDSM